MELALLDAFAHYYEQGCEAEQLETAEHNYDYLQREAAEQGKLMHGSYNYHNLLFQGREVVTSNFENAKVGIQIMDLYGFLRKTMEKNGWKQDLGRRMIASYEENGRCRRRRGICCIHCFCIRRSIGSSVTSIIMGKIMDVVKKL